LEYSNVILISFQVKEERLSIYPNPTSDLLQIQTAIPRYEVQIFDISGQPMLLFKDLSNSTSLEVQQLPKGVYIIELLDTESRQVLKKKMVKS